MHVTSQGMGTLVIPLVRGHLLSCGTALRSYYLLCLAQLNNFPTLHAHRVPVKESLGSVILFIFQCRADGLSDCRAKRCRKRSGVEEMRIENGW